MIDIDFRYQSMEIEKEKKGVTSINIDDFPIKIDNVFSSILLIDNNR